MIAIGLTLSLLIGMPLVGVLVAGQPVHPYVEFPPQTRFVQQAPFSWTIFLGLSVLVAVTVGPVVLQVATSRVAERGSTNTTRAFPWWGWLGATLTVFFWVLAWNRFPWFATFQTHTFTPLWVGYLLMINGWTFHRTGFCMMLDRPRFLLALFPASAVFWWCFEYLNRFVQNWYYVGPQTFTPWEYVLHATISFSTVLPSVLSTMELLASMPVVTAGLKQLPPLRLSNRHRTSWGVLIVATVGLAGIGIFPGLLFPLVWVAPLLLITAMQMLGGQDTLFSRTEQGDWSSLWLGAVAALGCGLCWELWNWKSLVHWEYAIPSVHRFQLFEMPLLGYAGYLPFGLDCLAVTQLLFPRSYQQMLEALPKVGAEPRGEDVPVGGVAKEKGYFKVWVFSASSSATRRMSSDNT
jgi:hypothetical protein